MNPFLHGFGKLLAPIYESPLWFPIVIKLLGGWNAPTIKDNIKFIRETMAPVKGLVLDVATGTGINGRHIAGPQRAVYGVDISVEMLRKAQKYMQRDRIQKMFLARADGDALPFGDAVFDGCLLCGCLHIFPDTRKKPCWRLAVRLNPALRFL